MTEEEIEDQIPALPKKKQRLVAVSEPLAEDGQRDLEGADSRIDATGNAEVFFSRTGVLLGKERTWESEEYCIRILFDARGKVAYRSLHEIKDFDFSDPEASESRGFFAMIRRLLR